MKKITGLLFLIMISTLNACAWEEIGARPSCNGNVCLDQQTEIFLQHPYTRVIVRCNASVEYAANACAEQFEREGYVRFRNIPYKVARYDFLKTDTYPTRRWRENERTPRW